MNRLFTAHSLSGIDFLAAPGQGGRFNKTADGSSHRWRGPYFARLAARPSFTGPRRRCCLTCNARGLRS